ncbi:MAG: hypothetical protein H7Y30_11095 [Pyrinomonadaceae bacterium]|nr:hypothetical protein [Pyrinomonadaceae bacterium]
MISDSPYKVDEMALSPFAGMFAGLVAAFLMLGIVILMEPYSGLSVESVLRQFATLVLPKRFEQMEPNTLMLIGLGVHLLLRLLLSLLYSVCQQRIPTRGLIAVGTFFGFILWITGSVIIGTLLGAEWRSASRSWTWLLANLAFGLCLATFAMIAQSRRPATTVAVPRD